MTAIRKNFDPTAFLKALRSPEDVFAMFDYLPRVYLFVKDTAGRFVKVNAGERLLHGCKSDAEIIGKTDFDFHPPAMATQYVEEDQRVMKSGQPLANQVWLVMGYDRLPRWYVSNKVPLFDKSGQVIGVAGVMRLYEPNETMGTAKNEYQRLTPVMKHVIAHFSKPITVEILANKAHLSVSQLQREFKKLFSLSPMDYLMRVRLLMARRMLEETSLPLGTVALDCGFYDQSHFSHTFKKFTGVSASAYRATYKRGPVLA